MTEQSPIELCPVLPAAYVDEQETLEALVRVEERRGTPDPRAAAERYLREVHDRNDLRAMGYCRVCGAEITLRQVGRCIYSSCGCYRVQGDLVRVRRFHERSLARLTPERKTALLALIGRGQASR